MPSRRHHCHEQNPRMSGRCLQCFIQKGVSRLTHRLRLARVGTNVALVSVLPIAAPCHTRSIDRIGGDRSGCGLQVIQSSLEALNMSGTAVIRLCVAHVVVVLFVVSGAAAQTNPANAPAQTQSPIPRGAPPVPSPGTSAPPLGPDGFLREPLFLSTGIDFLVDKFGDGTSEPKSGFYPELENMMTGAGWVSVGPGYRQYLNNDHLLLDTSAAISWRFYKMMQARVEGLDLVDGHLLVGAQAMWRDDTQVNFFGIPGVNEDQTLYRLQSLDIVGYGTWYANDWLAFVASLVAAVSVFLFVKNALYRKYVQPISGYSDEMLVARYNEVKADQRAGRMRATVIWAVVLIIAVILGLVWLAAQRP